MSDNTEYMAEVARLTEAIAVLCGCPERDAELAEVRAVLAVAVGETLVRGAPTVTARLAMAQELRHAAEEAYERAQKALVAPRCPICGDEWAVRLCARCTPPDDQAARLAQEVEYLRAERDALRKRIEEAPVAWAQFSARTPGEVVMVTLNGIFAAEVDRRGGGVHPVRIIRWPAPEVTP